MIIGVTGGVGSGKSLVAARLGKLLVAVVVSADDICRELLEPGHPGYNRFTQSAGQRFLDADGAIDRGKLRNELFRNAELKKELESILHPLVLDRIRDVEKQNPEVPVIAEVPLLFESGWQDEFDFVIAVSSPHAQLIERVASRDGVSREAVREIIAAQMSPVEKNKRAGFVIDNGSDLQQTEKQLSALAEMLRKRISGRER